ncbi:hypothetical protein F4809DRAFT_607296 [Biscogniauxia mediterranea]|nr:hypothetical protein F4809DRAFT_607296 [Biscogniauxia mediterranea]
MTESPPPHQEELITLTRHLTSIPSARRVMPPASPDFLFPVEDGNVTPQQSGQGERASGTAATNIDAQPSSLVVLSLARDSVHPDYLGEANTIFDEGRRTDAGQAAVVTNSSAQGTDSLGLSALSSSREGPPIDGGPVGEWTTQTVMGKTSSLLRWGWDRMNLDGLPNEILMHILGFLDVCDLLATSRINHHFRTLSLHPTLHAYRLRRARTVLPPLLTSPSRPTLPELVSRHIVQTQNALVSRRLARNFAEIGLKRRLRQRPTAATLVERGVLPPECSSDLVAPGLVARKREVERERLKDGLRRWVGGVWKGEVRERAEGVRRYEERAGVGRVWRLRRFWERVGRGEGEGQGERGVV